MKILDNLKKIKNQITNGHNWKEYYYERNNVSYFGYECSCGLFLNAEHETYTVNNIRLDDLYERFKSLNVTDSCEGVRMHIALD